MKHWIGLVVLFILYIAFVGLCVWQKHIEQKVLEKRFACLERGGHEYGFTEVKKGRPVEIIWYKPYEDGNDIVYPEVHWYNVRYYFACKQCSKVIQKLDYNLSTEEQSAVKALGLD